MAEKKKRWRPSLTAYRALENEVSELKEQNRLLSEEVSSLRCEINESHPSGVCVSAKTFEKVVRDSEDAVSMLVRDCDAWREQYHELKNRGLWARILNR